MAWVALTGWLTALFFALMYRAELNRAIEAEDKLVRASIQYIRNLSKKDVQ